MSTAVARVWEHGAVVRSCAAEAATLLHTKAEVTTSCFWVDRRNGYFVLGREECF